MHIHQHGDAVKNLALRVDDAISAWEETTKRGARSFMSPVHLSDEGGEMVMSGIHTYGETVHLFIERKNYNGIFMPGYRKWESAYNPSSTGLQYVDHCVGNVGWNQMNTWVKFYEDVMGFKNILTFDDNDISTEYSALMSKVMSNGNGFVKFPINEPAEGKKKSQVEEYLEFYRGEGVQHVALATNNIIETVTDLQQRGIEFLKIPGSYYDELLDRVGHIDEDLAPLKKLGIWLIVMKRVTCCKYLQNRSKTGPHYFSRSFKEKEPKVWKGKLQSLFEAIEESRNCAGICRIFLIEQLNIEY
jgi:4-hydroxyphenylpyruvate dioxygenase